MFKLLALAIIAAVIYLAIRLDDLEGSRCRFIVCTEVDITYTPGRGIE